MGCVTMSSAKLRPFSYRHDYCCTQLFWLLYGSCSRKIRASGLGFRVWMMMMIGKTLIQFKSI